MRAVAAVAAVAQAVAVAVAAASAGTGAASLDFSITKITYTTRIPKRPVTEICIDKDGVLTEISLISLTIKEEGSLPKPHQPIKHSIKDNCVPFPAAMPYAPSSESSEPVELAEGTVVYTLRVRDDSAKVTFFFQELKDKGQIKCGDQQFEVTKLGTSCPGVQLQGKNNCYKPVASPEVTAEGCIQPPDLQGFQYCQPAAVYAQGDAKPAKSLQYLSSTDPGTATLTLADAAIDPDNDLDVLVVVAGDITSSLAPVPTLTNPESSVSLDPFTRSTNTYTACPVEDDFTAYNITDLYIFAKKEKDEEKGFYEFELKYTDSAHPKFAASTPATTGDTTAPSTIVNCKHLTPGDDTRCYGWVQYEDNHPLTVSYYDDSNPTDGITNSIILTTDVMK